MVRLFPLITETYYSPLAPAELLRQVGRISVPDGVPKPQPVPLFQGRVWADSFRLDRLFDNGRVMATARIRGRVRPAVGRAGCVVQLRYGLYPSMFIFATVWMTGVSAGVVASAAHLVDTHRVGEFSIIPFGMFVFGLFFFNAPFVGEVAELRVLIKQKLALEEVPPQKMPIGG